MKESVDVWYEHGDKNDRQNLFNCVLPALRITPHQTKLGKDITRKPHCWLAHIHREEAGNNRYWYRYKRS